jgi:DNA-directed RNA polymerase subunit RPC12/RpoP
MASKVYTCTKCSKTFTKKGYLDNHLTQKYQCDEPISCEICGDEFTTISGLNRHKRRKTSCKKIKTEQGAPAPIITKDNIDNKCSICGKTYASRYNLRRHNKSCTIQDRGPDILKLFANQQKQIELLTMQVSNSQNVTINNTINNTVNQVQNNMYVNVTICSFGNEDLSKLDSAKVLNLIKGSANDFMPKMIEHVHANPEHPEFHNVFYDPKQEKAIVFAPISETEMSWQPRDFSEVSANLTKKIKEHIRPGAGPYFDQAMQAKDSETSNKIINIVNAIDWDTNDVLEKTKGSLSKVSQNKEFMELVEIAE